MKYTEPITLGKEQSPTTRRKKSTIRLFDFVCVFFFLLIWTVLIYGGFYFTKQYLDTALHNVQQTNIVNLMEVKERLDSLSGEMKALQNELINTDQTLSSSGNIQAQLNRKIELLDTQLKNLEKSLKILKEAP